MKNAVRIFGLPVISVLIGLLMTGCYTQIGSVQDEYSSYNEYSNNDTVGEGSSSGNTYESYDDNFYGYNSFSRYRYFSYYYPTYYWSWSYDPWYDYGWYNPWYGSWYNPWYSPYYGGGWGAHYTHYDPWLWSGSHWDNGHHGYYNSPGSTVGKRPFGQGRGRTNDTDPADNGRGTIRNGSQSLPAVDLPSAAGVDRTGTAGSGGTSIRKQPAGQTGSGQKSGGTSVRKAPSSSGRSSSGNTSSGSSGSGRSRTEVRQSSPPPSSPSHDSGSRSSGGSSGGDRGSSSGRSGGGDRGGSSRGR